MSWVTSLRWPPVRVTASGMLVASVIRWSLLPVLPRSTGLRPVLGPLLTPGCESRRPPHGRSPGCPRCGAWPRALREAGATRRPQPTRPGAASTSCPSRSPVVAAGVPTGSRYAVRTGRPGRPSGPDAASALDDGCDARLSATAVRSPPTVNPRHATASAEPPHTPGSTLPKRSNHLENHFVRSPKTILGGYLVGFVNRDGTSWVRTDRSHVRRARSSPRGAKGRQGAPRPGRHVLPRQRAPHRRPCRPPRGAAGHSASRPVLTPKTVVMTVQCG